jgi:large subunit ribosomal protein L6
MSRIGRLPIPVPSNVDVTIDGRNVTVTGPKGTLSRALHPDITVSREDGRSSSPARLSRRTLISAPRLT